MSKSLLFTDGSANPQTQVGFGAYLLLQKDNIFCPASLQNIQTKKFEHTSSTKLELETLLWAFKEIDIKLFPVLVYTDCQNILSLMSRREKFEQNNYKSKTGKEIKNHLLYKEFYIFTDLHKCEFSKIKGHKKKEFKDELDKIFSLVDKTARNALRENTLQESHL
ncbi:ribonuclease H [bacterium]|nr:ribonuclease H [bacterium]MBU1434583.1 ribonuclease H [bacterium]MBU1502161.1 ribonuclease H [bacterium]